MLTLIFQMFESDAENTIDLLVTFSGTTRMIHSVRIDGPLIAYEESQCGTTQQIESMLHVVEMISYFIMAVSLITCKIVGLELFGLLQLSYFVQGNGHFVSLYLRPLSKFKHLNGPSFEVFEEA